MPSSITEYMLKRNPRPSSIPKPIPTPTPEQTEQISNSSTTSVPLEDLLEYSANIRIHKKVTKLRIRSSVLALFLIALNIDIRTEPFPRRTLIKTLRPFIKEYINEYETGAYKNFKGISGTITDKLMRAVFKISDVPVSEFHNIVKIVGAPYADANGKEEEQEDFKFQ